MVNCPWCLWSETQLPLKPLVLFLGGNLCPETAWKAQKWLACFAIQVSGFCDHNGSHLFISLQTLIILVTNKWSMCFIDIRDKEGEDFMGDNGQFTATIDHYNQLNENSVNQNQSITVPKNVTLEDFSISYGTVEYICFVILPVAIMACAFILILVPVVELFKVKFLYLVVWPRC